MKTKKSSLIIILFFIMFFLPFSVNAIPPPITYKIIPTPSVSFDNTEVIFSAVNMENGLMMAIKNDNTLWAWGTNEIKVFGDDIYELRLNPVKIMNDVIQVSSGISQAMALKVDGSLWKIKSIPVKIMDDVIQVSTEHYRTMAIKNDGTLWAWGWNWYGQLGDGTTTERLTPVKIMDDVIQVSVGISHTMAIKNDGSLWAWGLNEYGQLGDSTTTDRIIPIKIMDNVIQVSSGKYHTMAVKDDNSLWAWGTNYNGEFGNGMTTNSSTPIKIMDDVVKVSAGSGYTMIIKNDSSLWACGFNRYGQLGLGDRTVTNYDYFEDGTRLEYYENQLIPVKIMDNVIQISTGYPHTTVITSDGSLWAWGSGYLGDGTEGRKISPVKIMNGKLVASPQTGNTINIIILFYIIFFSAILYKKVKII